MVLRGLKTAFVRLRKWAQVRCSAQIITWYELRFSCSWPCFISIVGLLEGEESLRVHKNVKQYLEWLTGGLGRGSIVLV
jgi:hypothetical protein